MNIQELGSNVPQILVNESIKYLTMQTGFVINKNTILGLRGIFDIALNDLKGIFLAPERITDH